MVKAGGLVGTKETAQKEGASEAEAAGVMNVVVMTAAVATTAEDMTVAVEADLLVWGKLHMPLPLRYPFVCLIIVCVIWPCNPPIPHNYEHQPGHRSVLISDVLKYPTMVHSKKKFFLNQLDQVLSKTWVCVKT